MSKETYHLMIIDQSYQPYGGAEVHIEEWTSKTQLNQKLEEVYAEYEDSDSEAPDVYVFKGKRMFPVMQVK